MRLSPTPAPLPCVEGAVVGAGTGLAPGTAQGWEAALGSVCLQSTGDQLCHPTALQSSGHSACPQLAGRGQALLGAGGCGDMLGGTGVMGSPPSLPGAEQEAEQVVFPRREKAAYVPGSPARGGGAGARDSPGAGGARGPPVPVMACRTSTALQQHVSLLPGTSSMHPLGHPREDWNPRRCCRDWLAPGHQLMVAFTQSQQQGVESHVPAQQDGGSQPCPGAVAPCSSSGRTHRNATSSWMSMHPCSPARPENRLV